tara:strand:- start:38017 stop:38358 length:342 start_codon:yes stop_codon:yes gene_type:complete
MNNKQILDNAPEGATHVLFQSLDNIYIKFDVHTQGRLYCKHKEGWRLATHVFYARLRSLSDLRRIVEIEAQLEMAKEKNYTLTKTYNNLFDSYQYLEDEMIEIKGQQAQEQGE